MLCLYVQAPFAAFRSFAAGSFRPTAPFITSSAAYGLLLNLAGIEMRAPDNGKSSMTSIREGLPPVEIALGALDFPCQHSMYQQLHNYPVGASGAEHAPNTKGSKYNIVPARRAFLSDLRVYICMRQNDGLGQRIRDGLAGKHRRYGVPFLGDNNFMPDRIVLIDSTAMKPAHWYVPVAPEDDAQSTVGIARFTVTIDRVDMSRTVSELLRPLVEPSDEVPDGAWLSIGYG